MGSTTVLSCATAFEESIVEEISLPFNSTSIELLLVAVDTLLRRGYARPELGGRFVGAAALQGRARGWPPWAVSVAFKEPVGRWEGAAALVRNRLELEPPQIPVEDVTLTLSDFRGGTGMQMGLFEDVKETAGRRLMEMERRLQVRMNGKHILHRIAEVAPWHPAPEMRAMQIPIDPAKREDIRPLHAPTPVAVREGAGGEPVAVQLARRWRGVARIADRWTFDLWWLAQPITRAYYRIGLSENGQAGGNGSNGSGFDDGQVTLFGIGRMGWFLVVCGTAEGRKARGCNGNTFYPRRGAKGREERQLQRFYPRRGAEGGFIRKGRSGTATATTPFIREGARRVAKNGNCNGNTFWEGADTENGYCNTFYPRREGRGVTAHGATAFSRGENGNWAFLRGRGAPENTREGRTARPPKKQGLLGKVNCKG